MRNQLVCLLALAGVMPAQSNLLSGPTQGFVFDAPTRSVRQVVGSFGSAALGPVALGGLDLASVAPQKAYGVGCAAEECFLFAGLGSPELQRSALPAQFGTPQAVAWSSDGRTAALYSRDQQWLRVLQVASDGGLLEAGTQWSVESLGGQLVSLAVRPNGKMVVIGLAGEHPGVFEATAEGNFVPLLETEDPVSLAFSSNGAALYVLDAGRRQITERNMIDGLAHSWPVEVTDPVALQPGQDGESNAVLYVAGHDDHALFVYDVASHQTRGVVELTFAPSQVEAAGGGYLLTSRTEADEVLWSYTAGRGVYFVPVSPVDGATQRGRRR